MFLILSIRWTRCGWRWPQKIDILMQLRYHGIKPVSYTHLDVYKRQNPDYIKIGKILEELEQAISSLDDKEKNKCNICLLYTSKDDWWHRGRENQLRCHKGLIPSGRKLYPCLLYTSLISSWRKRWYLFIFLPIAYSMNSLYTFSAVLISWLQKHMITQEVSG